MEAKTAAKSAASVKYLLVLHKSMRFSAYLVQRVVLNITKGGRKHEEAPLRERCGSLFMLLHLALLIYNWIMWKREEVGRRLLHIMCRSCVFVSIHVCRYLPTYVCVMYVSFM